MKFFRLLAILVCITSAALSNASSNSKLTRIRRTALFSTGGFRTPEYHFWSQSLSALDSTDNGSRLREFQRITSGGDRFINWRTVTGHDGYVESLQSVQRLLTSRSDQINPITLRMISASANSVLESRVRRAQELGGADRGHERVIRSWTSLSNSLGRSVALGGAGEGGRGGVIIPGFGGFGERGGRGGRRGGGRGGGRSGSRG